MKKESKSQMKKESKIKMRTPSSLGYDKIHKLTKTNN